MMDIMSISKQHSVSQELVLTDRHYNGFDFLMEEDPEDQYRWVKQFERAQNLTRDEFGSQLITPSFAESEQRYARFNFDDVDMNAYIFTDSSDSTTTEIDGIELSDNSDSYASLSNLKNNAKRGRDQLYLTIPATPAKLNKKANTSTNMFSFVSSSSSSFVYPISGLSEENIYWGSDSNEWNEMPRYSANVRVSTAFTDSGGRMFTDMIHAYSPDFLKHVHSIMTRPSVKWPPPAHNLVLMDLAVNWLCKSLQQIQLPEMNSDNSGDSGDSGDSSDDDKENGCQYMFQLLPPQFHLTNDCFARLKKIVELLGIEAKREEATGKHYKHLDTADDNFNAKKARTSGRRGPRYFILIKGSVSAFCWLRNRFQAQALCDNTEVSINNTANVANTAVVEAQAKFYHSDEVGDMDMDF